MLKNGTFPQLLRRPHPESKVKRLTRQSPSSAPTVTMTSVRDSTPGGPLAWVETADGGLMNFRPTGPVANDTGGTDYTISNVPRSGSASNADLVGRIGGRNLSCISWGESKLSGALARLSYDHRLTCAEDNRLDPKLAKVFVCAKS